MVPSGSRTEYWPVRVFVSYHSIYQKNAEDFTFNDISVARFMMRLAITSMVIVHSVGKAILGVGLHILKKVSLSFAKSSSFAMECRFEWPILTCYNEFWKI